MIKYTWIFVLILAAKIKFSSQQAFYPLCCPSVSTQSNLSVSNILGQWYEQERYPTHYEGCNKCVTTTFSNNNGITTLHYQGTDGIIGIPNAFYGFSYYVGNGKFLVQLPDPIFGYFNPYWILGTDYLTYAVAYACYDRLIYNVRYLWVLTRDKHPSQATMDNAHAVIDANGLSRTWLTTTNQNC